MTKTMGVPAPTRADHRRLRHADFLFFFHAEDGIRAGRVTGVQTCALPILHAARHSFATLLGELEITDRTTQAIKIGRASCRERAVNAAAAGSVENIGALWHDPLYQSSDGQELDEPASIALHLLIAVAPLYA